MSTSSALLDSNERIEVLPAFRLVNEHLVELLESLRPEEWTLPTVHTTRDVKDLVAHLVDGSLRRLSAQRDGRPGKTPGVIPTTQALIDFIQTMNREWMTAA